MTAALRSLAVVSVVFGVMIRSAGLAAQSSAAADPHAVQPERPTVATHAGTVAAGWAEIEAGIELDRYSNESRGAVAPLLLKLGLARSLQLNVQGPVVWPPGQNATGLGDVSVGLKWRLVDAAPLLGDFAILPGLKVPSGSADSGTGTGTTDVSLLFIASRALGAVAMDLNLGFTRRSGDGTIAPRNSSVWTASFGGSARGRLGWVAELFGYPATSGPAGADAIVAALGGPTFEVRPWLVLDAGVVLPVTGSQPRAVYVGTVYNVGRLWFLP